MEKLDIKVNWKDTPAQNVGKLLELAIEQGISIDMTFPNGFRVDNAQKSNKKSGNEWLLSGASVEMEGTIRLASLPEQWISELHALLVTKLGIGMTDRQQRINEMYIELSHLIYNNTSYLKWPNDDVSYIDDVDKVLDGNCEEGDSASEYYGNGDFTLKGLYEERAQLQLKVIKDLFNGFVKMAEEEEEEPDNGENTDK